MGSRLLIRFEVGGCNCGALVVEQYKEPKTSLLIGTCMNFEVTTDDQQRGRRQDFARVDVSTRRVDIWGGLGVFSPEKPSLPNKADLCGWWGGVRRGCRQTTYGPQPELWWPECQVLLKALRDVHVHLKTIYSTNSQVLPLKN